MVCDPGRAVPDMDDPALLKAALLDQPLHRRIVGVGIDADIGGKEAGNARRRIGTARGPARRRPADGS